MQEKTLKSFLTSLFEEYKSLKVTKEELLKNKNQYNDKIEKEIKEFIYPFFENKKYNLQGHNPRFDNQLITNEFKFKSSPLEVIIDKLSMIFFSYVMDYFNNDLESVKDFNRYIERVELFLGESIQCDCCGLRYLIEFDVKNFELITKTYEHDGIKPCEYNNFNNYKLYLKIPSKKIVFTNYFRKILKKERYENFELSNVKGLLKHSRQYEKDNIGYVQVGNSSPTIYKYQGKIICGPISDEIKYIVNEFDKQNWNELTNEEKQSFNVEMEEYYFPEYNNDYSELFNLHKNIEKEYGYICTDLWAVSFMDYDQFKELLNKANIKEEEYGESLVIVDIEQTEIEVECLIGNQDEDRKYHFYINA